MVEGQTESLLTLGRFTLGLLSLFFVARFMGRAFSRVRQPAVIGEILGGLLLGPTVLGFLAPGWQHALFPMEGVSGRVLWMFEQLGLVLLMFCAGLEARSLFGSNERRSLIFIAAAGLVFPFGAGLILVQFIEPLLFIGPAASHGAFTLVFCVAIAVTSIPVISRILRDLGVLGSGFGRIVLSAAVIEDILLYGILGVAVSIASEASDSSGGILRLASTAGVGTGFLAHIAANGLFLGGSLAAAPLISRRFEVVPCKHFLMALLLVMLLVGGVLGISLMLSAFVAGVVAKAWSPDATLPSEASIKYWSFKYFVPLYFAIVGVKLDLLRHFDLFFFVMFLAVSSVIKIFSVYWGATLAGEKRLAALNFGVAMNARGGPGIVLASVALGAGIINLTFYGILVMLSVVTSLGAGIWLGWILRTRGTLRELEENTAS
jgi:Kef-type K+ transport system membrane component KefB